MRSRPRACPLTLSRSVTRSPARAHARSLACHPRNHPHNNRIIRSARVLRAAPAHTPAPACAANQHRGFAAKSAACAGPRPRQAPALPQIVGCAVVSLPPSSLAQLALLTCAHSVCEHPRTESNSLILRGLATTPSPPQFIPNSIYARTVARTLAYRRPHARTAMIHGGT
jgi:hypothetical protein